MARIERTHLLGFTAVLFIIDLITLSLAGWALDAIFDSTFNQGNAVSQIFASVTLIAGMAVVASIISGLIHYKHYRPETLTSSSSIALLAWCLLLLAFGLACKHIDAGGSKSKMRALEAFVFIMTFFQTVYVGLIHAGIFNNQIGLGYE